MDNAVTIVPMMGLSPCSHMGHYLDVGKALMGGGMGIVVVGVSAKNDGVFTTKERLEIISRQWFGKYHHRPYFEFITVSSAGQTVAHAYDRLVNFRPKTLQIFVGNDRIDYGQNLMRSIKEGKIPELSGGIFSEIRVVSPDTNRNVHGLSGTKMRTAARDRDYKQFIKHLGPNFDKVEANNIYERVIEAIDDERLSIRRK